MRSTSDQVSVRLYHLDGEAEGGAALTLFYGPLSEALRLACRSMTMDSRLIDLYKDMQTEDGRRKR